jgi:hypothetical protein
LRFSHSELSASTNDRRASCSITSSVRVRNCYAVSATGTGAALPRIRSEPFSAITMVAEQVLADGMLGITEASITRRFCRP